MTTNLHQLAKTLGGEVRGNQIVAPGPGHSELDRSLSIKLDDAAPDGFVTNSFAGDGFAACRDHVKAAMAADKTSSYNFCDPDTSTIRYRKFRVEKPDGSKHFRIAPSGRGGAAPLLYGGERLKELNGRPVVIVEGEKKVDRLRELGAIAVSGDSGAQSKWLPSHAELLRGLPVIFWPDSDAQGEKYIANAAAAIRAGDPDAELRVVRPFGPPNGTKGKDVCDWAGDAGTLAELAAGAKAYAPAERAADDEVNFDSKPTTIAGEGVSLKDFNAYMPTHSYIYTPSRDMWPAASVNARIPPVPLLDKKGKPMLNKDGTQKTLAAATWLDKNRAVEQMTWAPGEPMLIPDRLVSDGGWIEHAKVTCFNLYRPPTIKLGDATDVNPWLDHIKNVFPEESEHIIKWLAQRVQRPQEKINHAIVLGGEQGIGKDTILEPVKRAIGPGNFAEVSPLQMLGRFNGFFKSVILRVSEARDLGDRDRFQFYDHMKVCTAAPPDVLRCDEKHLREHSVFNCCGVIITTNHKSDGIYLPADDRRHFVAWSNAKKERFKPSYWNSLWNWYERDGNRNVAAYLAKLDISNFDPKAPPPKTPAFWDIVDANRAPEDAELADVLDAMGNPDATTLSKIALKAGATEIGWWLNDRKNRRIIPHRLEECGYVHVRNDAAKDGYWKIGDTRQAVYSRSDLPIRDRFKAAGKLI